LRRWGGGGSQNRWFKPVKESIDGGANGGGLEMGKLADKEDIDLNRVFIGNGRDLNRLFPDPSIKRLLKEIEQHKREVRTFLKALEIEDEGEGDGR
jgi:hypothetical protein